MKKILGIYETLMRLESRLHPSIISRSYLDHLYGITSVGRHLYQRVRRIGGGRRYSHLNAIVRDTRGYPLLGGFPPCQRTGLTGLPTAAKGVNHTE